MASIEKVSVRIKGLSPLIVHSDRMMDPFDRYKIEVSKITAKKTNKTDEDLKLLRRLEWEAGFYHGTEEAGPFLPGWNFIRSIKDGATKAERGKGKDMLTGIDVPDQVLIQYDGPRDLDGMYEAGERAYVDVRRVVIGGKGVMRARPIFRQWWMDIDITVDMHQVRSVEKLLEYITSAGMYAGIGSYRPSSPKGGRFGRYEIVPIEKKVKKSAAA
jgi:hypothetical protein